MTGPLAPLFAQVREESALLADWAEEPLGMGSVDVDNVRGRLLEALSSIERHVQDMEKALDYVARRKIALDALGLRHVADEARAALPAREKEEE